MDKYLRIVLATLAVLFVAWVVFSVFTREVGATSLHTAWVNQGDVKWSGVCKAEAPACNQISEGTEYGEQKQECKLLGGGGGFPCIIGQKRTIEVSRGCEVEGDVCDQAGSCSEVCGTPATEVPDGNGGTKVCEATPACEVPTPPKKDTPDAPKLRYSQGPNGTVGDGKCQLEWREIRGSKKVEIRYAEDGVFGNGYKTIMTKDDGAEWLPVDSAKVKLRGRDSKTEWSHARNLSC